MERLKRCPFPMGKCHVLTDQYVGFSAVGLDTSVPPLSASATTFGRGGAP